MGTKGVDVRRMKIDKRSRFTLRIPKEMMQMLEKEAEKNFVSVNAQILHILQKWLKEQREEE